MNEQNQQIIEQLNKCANIADEISIKENEISILQKKIRNGNDEQSMYKTQKKHTIVLTVLLLVTLIPSIIFAISAMSASKAWKNANDIISYPGEAYEAWMDSWANYNEFEELEPGWQAVQEDWKSRGLDISWEYVCDVWAKSNSRQDHFESRLKDSINADHASKIFTTYYVSVVVAAICIIASIVLGYFLRKKYKEFKYAQRMLSQAEKDSSSESIHLLHKNKNKLNQLQKQLTEVVDYMYTNFGIKRGDFHAKEISELMVKWNYSYEDALSSHLAYLREKARQEEETRKQQAIERREQENAYNLKRLADTQQQILIQNQKMAEQQKRALQARCSTCKRRHICSYERKQMPSCSEFIRN